MTLPELQRNKDTIRFHLARVEGQLSVVRTNLSTVCYSCQSWLVVAVFCQEDRLLPDDDLAAGDFRPPARGLLGGVYRLVPQLQEDHKDHEKDPG